MWGSRKLVKIFNRLGVTCSSDTHDRFVTAVASAQRDSTVWDNLPSNLFTTASVDNFDLLQSHAAVYSGDQYRSYHGTTIQLVQPNQSDVCTQINIPINTATSGQNISTDPCSDSITAPVVATKRHSTYSPSSSPHNWGKTGPKRPRTLQPRKLNEQLASVPRAITAKPEAITDKPEFITPNLIMQGFLEGSSEKAERHSFESKLFTYLFTKHCLLNARSDQILCDFKIIYSACDQVKCSSKQSNIHYMELVDEHPDSNETMRFVSELLLRTASSEHQDGYVVLTGDGKTYEHLMEIKRLYGNSLDKLLIFPGDWHTLNFFSLY